MNFGPCRLIAHIDEGEDGKAKDTHTSIENGQVSFIRNSGHPRFNVSKAQELGHVIEYTVIFPSRF